MYIIFLCSKRSVYIGYRVAISFLKVLNAITTPDPQNNTRYKLYSFLPYLKPEYLESAPMCLLDLRHQTESSFGVPRDLNIDTEDYRKTVTQFIYDKCFDQPQVLSIKPIDFEHLSNLDSPRIVSVKILFDRTKENFSKVYEKEDPEITGKGVNIREVLKKCDPLIRDSAKHVFHLLCFNKIESMSIHPEDDVTQNVVKPRHETFLGTPIPEDGKVLNMLWLTCKVNFKKK